jgi:photosystem II stability/assembly factor-like uncharacterized protein
MKPHLPQMPALPPGVTRRLTAGKAHLGAVNICLPTLILATWLLGAFPAWSQSPDLSAEGMLEWLRSLCLETRLVLQTEGGSPPPRLFAQAFPDGRTWMEYIADTLGVAVAGDSSHPQANQQWALLDEAASLLLAEADRMKSFSVSQAGQDPTKFLDARRGYLAGAARLLKYYQTSAVSAFDHASGALTNASGLPDWLLPGDIQLKEISGAARLNTKSGDFSGRLSGLLQLPGLDATLVVPNASFDSKGNLDLTAYGQANLPPGQSNQITLIVPERKPLTFHLADDGDFKVSGTAQVRIPGGNQFEASFEVDDPNYAFSFGFSGGINLDLAQHLAVLRPSIPTNSTDLLTQPALAAYGEFYARLNRGLESFLGDATNLPAPDPARGAPPEFASPAPALPYDVFEAWITALENDAVRTALSAALSASLDPIRETVSALQSDILAAGALGAAGTPTLPQVRQLDRLTQLSVRFQRVLTNAGAVQTLGAAAADMAISASGAVNQALRVAADLVNHTPPNADFKLGFAALRFLCRAAESATLTPAAAGLDIAAAQAKAAKWREDVFSLMGFHGDGSVADPNKVNGLDVADLRVLTLAAFELEAVNTSLGGPSVNLAPLFARREFDRAQAFFDSAVARGEVETRMLASIRWLDVAALRAVIPYAATSAEQQNSVIALVNSYDALASKNGGGLAGQRVATATFANLVSSTMAAGERVLRRKAELFGESEPISNFSSRLALDFYEHTYFQKLSVAVRALQQAGLISSPDLGRYQSLATALVRLRNNAITNRFGTAAQVARDITGARDVLLETTDAIAFLEDFVPTDNATINETRTTWLALHGLWIQAVTANRNHFLLASYVQQLAKSLVRYGGGLPTPLATDFRQSGTEIVAALSSVADALASAVNQLDATALRFSLPGNLKIPRLTGQLAFNRVSGDWSIGFGGRLELPNTGFSLEVVKATLSRNGAYDLTLAAAGNVPVGDQSRVRLSLDSLHGAGSPGGPFTLAGQGTMNLDTGAGFAAGPSVSVTADFNSGSGELALGTTTSSLRLSDQFAVLNGVVAASFNASHPEGALTVSGKLGLLARQSLPTNRALVDSDFWLTIDALPTTFLYSNNAVTAQFTGGAITLPPDLFEQDQTTNRLPVTVGITGLLKVTYDFAQNQLSFASSPGQPFTVALQHLRLKLDELPGFALAIESATLELSGTQFPLLKNMTASLSLPLPGADATDTNRNRNVVLSMNAQNWRLDGLPEAASIAIGNDLRLADFSGLTFDMLTGSGFSLASETVQGRRHTTFGFSGSVRTGFDQRVLSNDTNGTAVQFTAGGSFSWDMLQPPVFSLTTLAFDGSFRLGPDGPRITGRNQGELAHLTMSGLDNFFHQSASRPFVITLDGALEVPNVVKFGLIDTKFIVDGNGIRFSPGGAEAELGQQSLDIVRDALPVYLSKVGLSFRNLNLPLLPSGNLPGLFDLTNVVLTISGAVNLPNGAALDAGTPGFSGEVKDLTMGLTRDAQHQLVPSFSLNGLGLELKNVDIPPLGGLNGGLFVGNLNDADNLYFAGTVSGTVNDVGAGITMAIHRKKGLLGSCFELDVGPAGIPIDGGALGGILLTGGQGGLSFGNQFADPCDFRSYIQFTTVNGQKQPVNHGTTDTFDSTGSPAPVTIPPSPPASGDPNSCITSDFPPATINPLCEPHPTISNRIIFKGTVLSEAQLNALGLTPNALPRSLNAAVAFAVSKISQPARDLMNGLLAAVPPGIPAETKAFYSDLLNKQIRQLEHTASSMLLNTIGAALDQNPNASLYSAIVSAASQGIPCLDATLKLQGNFSHAAVSTVLKGEGSVTLSTTGTSLMQGTIKLVGIPIGEGTLAFSLTDTHGSVNPSFGGVVHAGVGPLTLGDMSLAYECDGCFDTVINAFSGFLAANAQNLGADVRQFLVLMMNRSVPLAQPRPLNGDPNSLFQALTPRQKLGYIVSLFNVIDVIASGHTFSDVTSQTVFGFTASFRQFVSDVATQVNPRFCFQAKVRPALFGFPLVPGPTPLDARFAYERVHDDALNQDFQQLSASAVFSPAFILGTLTTGTLALLAPGTDQANLGFSFRMPAFTPATVELGMNNPALFAANQFTSLLQDSTMTFGYAFMPLGIPLAEGQARVVMPRLVAHPTNPNRAGGAWHLPQGSGIATREEVILAALVRARLPDPNWRGQRGELADLFAPFNPAPPPGSAAERIANIGAHLNLAQMAQLGFAEDYFPHGGIIGASQLQLPSMIVQAPPVQLIARVFDVSNPNWIADAQELFTTYLVANSSVGQMALYIPAPNPPLGFDFSRGTAEDLIHAISQADAFAIIQKTAPQGLYPFDQVMLSGWIRAQLLGMPLGEGSILFDGNAGSFKVHAGVVQGSWLQSFIGANADLEIRKPAFMSSAFAGNTVEDLYAAIPKKTMQERFSDRRSQLSGNASPDFIRDTVGLIEQTLPKASLEMAAQLQLPPQLQSMLRQKAGTAVTFFAFSPAFDPTFGLNGPAPDDDDTSPYAVAKRRGGMGLKGQFELGLNLQDNNTNNDLSIFIPDASFSVTPDANAGVIPALSAQFQVKDINLPGLPRFTNGLIAFSSSPDNLAPYLSLAGQVQSFDITIPIPGTPAVVPLAQFRARQTGGMVGGALSIFRDDSIPVAKAGSRLSIDAMRAVMPLFGPNVALTVFGTQNGSTFTPFRFSTAPGEPWSATVRIHAANNENAAPVFGLCDPRSVTQDSQGNWIGNPAAAVMTFALNAPIIGSLEGVGLQSMRLTVNLPQLQNVTFFPNSPLKTEISTLGSGSSSGVLMVEKSASDGQPRFYVDFGAVTNLGLPGILTANGRLEIGYNPTAVPGPITHTPDAINFPVTEVCAQAPAVRQVTIANSRSEPVNVQLELSNPDDFTLSQSQFTLARNNGQRVVNVLFHPVAPGTRSGILIVTSDNPDSPTQSILLGGTATASPKYFQSRDSIAFGDTAVGQVAAGTIIVGNEGCSNLNLTEITITGAQASTFTVTPAGPISLAPGQSQLYQVEFAPVTPPVPPVVQIPHAASLTFSMGKTESHVVSLSGNATDTRWLTLLDADTTGSSADLNDVLMLDGRNGWVVGNGGAAYETKDGGRSWKPRVLTQFNLNALHAEDVLATPVLAAYHFEEPPGSTWYRDDGPSGRHAQAEVGLPNAVPSAGFNNGRFGSGLAFDGLGDAVKIAGPLVLPNTASLSVWVSVTAPATDAVLLAQTNPRDDSNILSVETSKSSYLVRFGAQVFNSGAVGAGWQHLVLTLSYSTVGDTTTARLFRNGQLLWTHPFTGALPKSDLSIWSLGARYVKAKPASFFGGQMDELFFFAGLLASGEISALASGDGGLRLLIAGDEGTVLESETLGRTWHKVFDLNPDGWRQRSRTYFDYDWKGVTIASGGQVVLSGTRRTTAGIAVSSGVIMVEDLFPGLASIVGDERYDEVPFAGSTINGVDVVFNAAIGSESFGGRVFGFTREGRVFQSPPNLADNWTQHGTLDVNLPINDAVLFGSNSYVAVGNSGVIIRSLSGAPPAQVIHGLTASNLRGIDFTGTTNSTVPSLHVVGDGGLYMHSANLGASWTRTADGLTGNNRAVSVRVNGVGYESWVAGERQQVQYRPPQPQAAPFMTCYPGELDFGMLTVGQSRTLTLEIRNRGKRDLTLSRLKVDGPGFDLVQGAVTQIAPGDAMALQVRFKPASETAYVQGDLALDSNDGGRTFHIPLVGRASGLEWQPVALNDASGAISGDVIDLGFTTDTIGYALLPGRLMKTIDGGLTWSNITPLPPSQLVTFGFRSMDVRRFGSTDVIYLAGSSRQVLTRLASGVIWRSADGGSSWVTRTPPTSGLLVSHPPFGDVAMLYDDANVAVCVTSDPDNHSADVWQTSDGGVSWSRKNQPPDQLVIGSTNHPSFDGGRVLVEEALNGAVPPANGWLVVATDQSAIYSRGFNNEWPYVSTFPTSSGEEQLQFDPLQPIKSLRFGRDSFNLLSAGWVVGSQGLYWYWLPKPPNRFPFAGTESEWFPASSQEVFGRTDLEAVSFAPDNLNGAIVGGNKIFSSKDGGRSWDLDFVTGEETSVKSVFVRSKSKAWVGGSLAQKAVVWRYRDGKIPAQGIIAVNDIEIFPGSILPGTTAVKSITIQNIGNAPLGIQHIGIENHESIVRYRLVGDVPQKVAAGSSAKLQVAFDATPEPIKLESMSPLFFHRFEQGFQDSRFFDSGPAHVDIDFAQPPLQPVANRPKIVSDPLRRDRCALFDGSDFLQVPGPEIFPGDFSLSLWVNPANTNDNQAFIGKHSAAGDDLFVFGFFQGGYQVNLRGLTFAGGAKKTGWQHLVVTGARVAATPATVVTVYRDGEILWQQKYSAALDAATGLPWIVGADWDRGPVLSDFFTGQMDDVGLFGRLLTEQKRRALAAKSPVCGTHRARLVLRTDAENGERATELRAQVQETAGVVIVDTTPSGAAVTIDGVSYKTPATFAVGCSASTAREWTEGSLHTIELPAAQKVDAGSGIVSYVFTDWSLQNSRSNKLSVVARPNLGKLIGRYRIKEIVTKALAPTLSTLELPPTSLLEAVAAGSSSVINLDSLVAGTPAGPWFRITGGKIAVPNLGSDGFAISGELFASLAQIKASLSSTALSWPQTGSRLLEVGAGEWQLDVLAGSHFRMRTHPASLTLLGYDVAPDGEFQLNFDFVTNFYAASFNLLDDFRPVPAFLEVAKNSTNHLAAVSLSVGFPANQTPILALRLDGRLRFLELPSNVSGQNGWAVDRDVALRFNSADFNLSLKNDVVGAANWPASLFNGGPIALTAGDVRLFRNNNGPITLGLTNLNLNVNGTQAATVSGNIDTSSVLALSGSISGNAQLNLINGGKFFLKSRDGGPLAFDMQLQALPNPRIQLNLPAMRLRCVPSAGVDPLEVNVPPVNFDTSGAFDTGKLALPSGLAFDGINLTTPDDATLDDNYVRLSRDPDGRIAFVLRAQQKFEVPGVLSCFNDMKATLDSSTVSASYRGNFCVLPEPISLSFDGNSSCQFSGSAFGNTIFFGSQCLGIRNDATGVCVGGCQ